MKAPTSVAVAAFCFGLLVVSMAVAAACHTGSPDQSVELRGTGWAVVSDSANPAASGEIDVDSSATRQDLDQMVANEDIQKQVKSGHIKVLDMDDSELVAGVASSLFQRLPGLNELRIGGPVIVDGAYADGYAFLAGSVGGPGPIAFEGKPPTEPPPDDDAELSGVAKIDGLEVLSVEKNITDTGLGSLKKLTGLRVLHVGLAKRITGDFLAQLRGLDKLESLVLPATDLTDSGLENLKYFPQLTELSIGLHACATWLVAHKPGESRVTDGGMRCLNSLPNLRKLQISGLDITGKGMLAFGALTKLETLEIDDLPKISAKLEWDVKGLRNLKKLTIRNTLTSSAALTHLSELPALQDLTLDDTHLDDAGARCLSGLGKLRRLHIENQMAFTLPANGDASDGKVDFLLRGSGLSAALETMPMLEELVISDCSVEDVIMPGIGSLGNLKRLRMIGTGVTTDGFRYLARLSKLESLEIPDGWNPSIIRDDVLKHLSGLTHLQSLDLGASVSVTDAGIAELGGLVELRRLTLPDKITDRGVEKLGSLRKLEAIDLGSGVTVKGLMFLRDHCPNLKAARVKGAYIEDGELHLEKQ